MAPQDPLSSWFDDADTRDDAASPGDGDLRADAAGRRRGLVVVGILATVVWATAAALWLAGNDTATQATASASPSAVPAASGTASATTPAARPTSDDIGALPVGEADAAAAVAEIGVHELVTGEGDERWVDAAALERWVRVADAPEPVAVGVVRTMLLEAGSDGWERRRQARYGVAVRCEAGACTAASDAWPLPLGDTPAPPGDRVPDGAATGYADALLAAGYNDPAVEVLSDPAPGVVEVEVVAVPPGGMAAETHRVWLRTSPFPAVIGASLPADRPSPDSRR